MAKQERIQKPRTTVHKNTRTEIIDQDKRTRSAKEAEALKQEMDQMLEDIDQALGENVETAQEFVDQYVQKGGQ